jgi:hypothetical protein
MKISAAHCREQEALHRDKALNEPLENRRKIALAAAKAWEVEAVLAEKVALRVGALNKLDAAIALEFELETKSGMAE